MVTFEQVRELAITLPRTTEHFIYGRWKYRVGSIVYLGFSRDLSTMGLAFPKEWRPVVVEAEPHKFMLPRESDLRFNWVIVSLAAIDDVEMRDLVLDAWRMVVPKRVAATYDELNRLSVSVRRGSFNS